VKPVPGRPPGRRTALPLLDGAGHPSEEPRERADAARNRRRVLAAAQDLFAERGVAAVTMDDVAARAGVGKGTLYRRFGDKGRLAVALLDQHERALQARILGGPGPLGPGPCDSGPLDPGPQGSGPAGVDGPAAPGERLAAFVRAYLDFLGTALDLVLLSQTATVGARHATGAHAFWRAHCRYLLAAAGAPDPDVRAEVLLAALAAEQVRYWRTTAHRPLDELGAALSRLAHALAADE
jgi:AcrR family transcriptional regulator